MSHDGHTINIGPVEVGEEKAFDPSTDPSIRSGPISGIQATIQQEPYEGSQTACWCYLVVSATSPDHSGGDIELIRSLLGIYEGDERPNLAHFRSTPGGVATGKWLPIEPDDPPLGHRPTMSELRAASAEQHLKPIQARLDSLLGELPRPVAALVRWYARRRG